MMENFTGTKNVDNKF